jgi:hypothetical protein
LQAAVWLFENWRVTPRHLTLHRILIAFNVFLVVLAAYLMVSGVSSPSKFSFIKLMHQTYGSVEEIIVSYREDGGSAPWTCADNSNST